MTDINESLIAFIERNATADTSMLRLRHAGKDMGFDLDFALMQIECRRKAASKLPSFTAIKDFMFPHTLSAEQATAEAVAEFHVSLARDAGSLLDMTSGLGIDVMSMAREIGNITAIDINADAADTLRHNAESLGVPGIKVITGDSVAWLRENPDEVFDIIFIDPARRGGNNSRTYSFADCQPDAAALAPYLLTRCRMLMIKASPMLDITKTAQEIHNATHIYTVGLRGECKEVLVTATPGGSFEAVSCVDIDASGNISRIDFSPDAINSHSPLAESIDELKEGMFLYEPSAPLMKIAPWRELASKFAGLKKLDVNTHLFLSEHLFQDFPGRITRVKGTASSAALKALKGKDYSVVSRNHPIKAEQLSKKLSLRPSGKRFIYAARMLGKPLTILTETI